jgi:energy-coupling factor transport system substrate-specific component
MTIFNVVLYNVAVYLNANNVPIPFWLDNVGTMIAALETGPLGGALVGLLTYGIYIFNRPDWVLFSINCILIGITTGVFARTVGITNWKKAVIIGAVAALIDIVFASAFDMYLYQGELDAVLGNAVFFALKRSQPLVLASLIAESVMSIPDKIVSALIAYTVYSIHSKKKRL